MELASAHSVSEEPTLAVIGLNHRSAEVQVRERFGVSEDRRYAALHNLARARGITDGCHPPAFPPASLAGGTRQPLKRNRRREKEK